LQVWLRECSSELSQESDLDDLSDEEHQVEIAEYHDDREGIVDGVNIAHSLLHDTIERDDTVHNCYLLV